MTIEEERTKAENLRQFYRICFAHPAVTGIMMWGFWEGSNWIPQSSLYTRDWSPTPALDYYRRLTKDEWWTRWSGTADASGTATVKAYFGTHRVTVDGKSRVVELNASRGPCEWSEELEDPAVHDVRTDDTQVVARAGDDLG